jgi:hypothetical protein
LVTFNGNRRISNTAKISIRTNSCVLCGFSFIETEITSSGERIVHKRFTQKVKLNPEKISIICDVISNFQLDPDIDKDNGVCVKCFRKVENAVKYQKDSLKIREVLPIDVRKTYCDWLFRNLSLNFDWLIKLHWIWPETWPLIGCF